MEKLIRENFMAEWQIEQEINLTSNNLKKYKKDFDLDVSDEDIDTICDRIIDAINIKFYHIRTGSNE